MAVAYYVKDTSASMPWHGNEGGAAIRYRLNCATVSTGAVGYFEDVNGTAIAVPTTGFEDGDTVSLPIPKGMFIGKDGCVMIHTAEGGAATAWLGVTGNTDLSFATTEIDLNSTTAQNVIAQDDVGHIVVDDATYLVLEFDTAATAVADFTILLLGSRVEIPAS